MIRTKKVRVNGTRAQPEQALAEGDVLTIRGDERALLGPRTARARLGPARSSTQPGRFHEDDWMMAVDKPSGMAVHTGSGITGGTLVDYVRAYLGPRAVRNDFTASPAHRLDRETVRGHRSSPSAARRWCTSPRSSPTAGAKKRYLTLVKGMLPQAAEGRSTCRSPSTSRRPSRRPAGA